MADSASEGQLVYGWFPVESVEGRSYRWAAPSAAALLRTEGPSRLLRLDYSQVPVDVGSVGLALREVGVDDPFRPLWSTNLKWRYAAQSVENHPLKLAPGDYEVVFSAEKGWSEGPLGVRSLSLALSSISLEEAFEASDGGIDMASPRVDQQLVSGWFEAEQGSGVSYRWAGAQAAGFVRLGRAVKQAQLDYRFPPISIGSLTITCTELGGEEGGQEARVAWRDGQWHAECLRFPLAAGEYLVVFTAEATWSNEGGKDPTLWPESRSLGFALASLRFS
jgi:hypothetical protein